MTTRRRAVALLAALTAFASASTAFTTASHADVIAVTGDAYGYWTNVSLFGGPSSAHGPAPEVKLPAGGSATPLTASAPDGAKSQYGPAVVFGGIWPDDAPTGGPSGPITVSTQGTPGPNGSVTSSVDIVLFNPPRAGDPGGIGPGPLIADEVHSTCTARESGVTASSRWVNGKVETKYDKDTQLPIPSAVKPIPANPPPNLEYTGTIDHVGDSFRIVVNEQIPNADGSLTVNAAHMYMLGPIAIGDSIVGHSVCGTTASPAATTPTQPAQITPPPTSPSPAPTSPAGTTPAATTPPPTNATPTTSTAPLPTLPGGPGPSTLSEPAPSSATGFPAGNNAATARAITPSNGGGFPVVPVGGAVVVGGGVAAVVLRRRWLTRGSRLPPG